MIGRRPGFLVRTLRAGLVRSQVSRTVDFMQPTDGRGGYQKPRKPAPVSGPGKLSKRTDGGPGQPVRDLPNPDYGEQQTFRADQAGAPMAQAPNPTGQAPLVQPVDTSGVVPLSAPSQRPGEPVTSGAASGPGAGPEALGLGPSANDTSIQYLRNMLPTLELMASMPMAGDVFRNYVRRVRAAM